MAVKGMTLVKQSKVLTSAGKGLKVSYEFVKGSRGVIGKHAANAAVGGVSSYTGSIATGDEHPYRSAAIGSAAGFVFGIKKVPTAKVALNIGAGAGFTSNLVGQAISYKNQEIENVSIAKLVFNGYAGGLLGGLTYGMPLAVAFIVGWGPSTVIGKLGDEIF